MSAAVADLRRVIAERFPEAVPPVYRAASGVATGVAALDRVLPGGGLPRGRLAVWAPGGGAASLLRAACVATAGRGERAVWVDGAGLETGDSWRPGPLLVRPRDSLAALVCAEELLRSGGFGLVVLTGAEREFTAESVRLERAARSGASAFVAMAGGDRSIPSAALRVASKIAPDGWRWRPGPFGEPAGVESARVRIEIASLGRRTHTEITLPVEDAELRLSLEPGLVDRRGA